MLLYSNIIGKGKPFLILHGFLGMGDNWKTHGKEISELGYEVHLIDQRNHGRSFHDDDFSYEDMAHDLKLYCEAHKLQNVIILGHSMGGKTAMLFTGENPEIVSKLIITDISPRYYPIHHDLILEGLASLESSGMTSRSEAESHLSYYVPEVGIRQWLLKNLYWVERGQLGFRFNLHALINNVEEVGESLPRHLIIRNETLFLRGDRSTYITFEDEDLIRAHFPNSHLQTIENAGHWLHADNPQAFFDSVKNFVT